MTKYHRGWLYCTVDER